MDIDGGEGSLSAWRPAFQKDSTSTAHVSRRKRHVCVRWCRSATPGTGVRTENLFDLDPFGRAQRGNIQRVILYGQAVCRCVFEIQWMRQTLSQPAPLRLQPRLPPSLHAPRAQSLTVPARPLENEPALHMTGHRVIHEHGHFRRRVSPQPRGMGGPGESAVSITH